MSDLRNISPPVLPIPQEIYSALQQNIANASLQQFGARVANVVNQFIQRTVPRNAEYSAEFTFPKGNEGIYRVNLRDNIIINPPQSGNDGDTTVLWLYAGGAGSKTVTLNSSIVVPSTITGATPITIALGKKAVYTIRYDGILNDGQWELVSFQNGY
jgi:hypothetical protein